MLFRSVSQSRYGVWEKELHVWWEFHPSFAIAPGSTDKKLKTISLDPETLITNYESLISPKIQKALMEFAPNVLICDESHRCKNPSAKRSKEVKKIADRCTYRLNLTGTPVTKSYLDLFQQFLILDGGQLLEIIFTVFEQNTLKIKTRHVAEHTTTFLIGLFVKIVKQLSMLC